MGIVVNLVAQGILFVIELAPFSVIDFRAETLRALHVERKKETLKKGWREVPPWVFLNGVGNPVDPDNFRKRVRPKILSKADLQYFPTPSLRHTFASRLIQNGATLLYVQHAMGHHSAAFTLRVYSHFQPTGNRSEADKLDDVLPAERTRDAKKTG
jgi:integrase